jgi:serine/threonine protein kinase
MFLREALVWRQLKHPHILPFLGVDMETFESGGLFCLVSPWLTGGTLGARAQSTTLPSSERVRLVRHPAIILIVWG